MATNGARTTANYFLCSVDENRMRPMAERSIETKDENRRGDETDDPGLIINATVPIELKSTGEIDSHRGGGHKGGTDRVGEISVLN